MTSNYFLKAIKLIRNGVCPSCYELKHAHKSGVNMFFCSQCGCTIIIERDYVIFEWYVIKHGRRVLRSMKIRSDSERWREMVNYLRDKRNT